MVVKRYDNGRDCRKRMMIDVNCQTRKGFRTTSLLQQS